MGEAPDGDGEYLPSASERAREQVALYEATDGVDGATLEGRPVVIVTMRGARTGKVRKTPLMKATMGEAYVVVASQGGAPRNPSWYHNLVAHPEVVVQDGATRSTRWAREVSGAEKAAAWSVAERAWPYFADYRARTTRDIPVFLLEEAPSS